MKPLAPAPVHYRLAPDGGLLLVLAALLVALGGVLLAWLLALRQAQQTGAAQCLALAAIYGGACVWTWRTARALPSGWLVWTGKCWQLQAQPQPQPASAQQTERAILPLATSSVAGTGIEWAGFEGAGRLPAVTYIACTLVLDVQRAVLLRLHGLHGPNGLNELQGQAAEPGANRHTARSRWLGWRLPAHGAAASAVWVWASRASDPAHWHALRCALVWAQAQQHMPTQAVHTMKARGGAAGRPSAPSVRTTETSQASKAVPTSTASAPQPDPAGGRESAFAESATASDWAAALGENRGRL